MRTIVLLVLSNVFMTFAWYGHLKYKEAPLWQAILVSWLIAFIEYCLQVPANRFGHGQYSAAQLKTIQEVITLVVFCGFSVLYLKEPLKWNYLVGFGLMFAAVFLCLRSSRASGLGFSGASYLACWKTGGWSRPLPLLGFSLGDAAFSDPRIGTDVPR